MATSVGPTTVKVTLSPGHLYTKEEKEDKSTPVPLVVGAGFWLTAGGYFVELNEDRRAKQEYCPGKSIGGSLATGFSYGLGWTWNSDGWISGLQPEWTDKLRIVSKLECAKPPVLPSRYKFKGGYPRFEEVKIGDTYMRMELHSRSFVGDQLKVNESWELPCKISVIEKNRILLEPITTPVEEPKMAAAKLTSTPAPSSTFLIKPDTTYITAGGFIIKPDKGRMFMGFIWNEDGTFPISCSDDERALKIVEEAPFDLPNLPSGYKWTGRYCLPEVKVPQAHEPFFGVNKEGKIINGSPIQNPYCISYDERPVIGSKRLVLSKIEDYQLSAKVEPITPPAEEKNNTVEKVGETFKFGKHSIQGYTYTFKTPPNISASELWTTVAPVVPAPKESKTKSLIGVGKFVTSLGLRGIKYFVIDAGVNIVTKVAHSIRYLILVGAVGGGSYFCYDPEGAKDFAKSLIPKISISFEKPEILQ